MPSGDEPQTTEDRTARRTLRGRLVKQERSSPTALRKGVCSSTGWGRLGPPLPKYRLRAGVFYRTRRVLSVRSTFERTASVVEEPTDNRDENGTITDLGRAKAEGDDLIPLRGR